MMDENKTKALGAQSATAVDTAGQAVPTTQLPHAAPAFTKGPWLVSSSWIVCTSEARIVGRCEPFPITELSLPLHECTANAHLIAASPDYYDGVADALKPTDGYNCEYVSIPVTAWRKILAAHAKAEGRAV